MSSNGLSSDRPSRRPSPPRRPPDRVRQARRARPRGPPPGSGSATIASSGASVRLPVEVEHRPLGQSRDEEVGSRPTWSQPRGDGHDLGPDRCRSPRRAWRWRAGARRGCSGVARSVLVATATLTMRRTLDRLVDDEPVAEADLLVGREADRDHVHLRPGRLDQVVEPLPTASGPVQTRGVDQDELGVGPGTRCRGRRSGWSAAART